MTAKQLTPPADEGGPAIDVYRQFRALIVSGQLGAGERLPTVRQVASDLGIAQGTAARAYKMLEHDGLVVTRTAAGTRVADSAALLPQAVLSRVRELAEEASASDTKLQDVVNVLRLLWPIQPSAIADDSNET